MITRSVIKADIGTSDGHVGLRRLRETIGSWIPDGGGFVTDNRRAPHERRRTTLIQSRGRK